MKSLPTRAPIVQGNSEHLTHNHIEEQMIFPLDLHQSKQKPHQHCQRTKVFWFCFFTVQYNYTSILKGYILMGWTFRIYSEGSSSKIIYKCLSFICRHTSIFLPCKSERERPGISGFEGSQGGGIQTTPTSQPVSVILFISTCNSK